MPFRFLPLTTSAVLLLATAAQPQSAPSKRAAPAPAPAQAPAASPANDPSTETLVDPIAASVLSQPGGVGLSIGVARKGRLLLSKGYGLADRDRAWWYALITTVSSVAGGVIGYLIGMFFFDAVGQQIIEFYDARDKFDKAVSWFDTYGVWIVFIAGFSPIPYKLFTITSGLLGMALVPFVLASIVGRAGQFFLVAALVVFGGERLEGSIRKYVEWLGWAVVAAAVVLWLVTRGR